MLVDEENHSSLAKTCNKEKEGLGILPSEEVLKPCHLLCHRMHFPLTICPVFDGLNKSYGTYKCLISSSTNAKF